MRLNAIPTEFGPDTEFELPLPAAAGATARANVENRFESLRRELLKEKLSDVWDTEANVTVRRAANEAAALAWTTPFPLLAYPELFEERVRTLAAQAERQMEIKQRSRELLAV